MVWKEPGKDKDPWNSTQRPPDLERLVKTLHKRLGWLFGGKRGGQHRFQAGMLWWLLPVIILAWLMSGFYKVAPGERGANFVFGRYIGAVSPGLHWHAPWPVGHAAVINGLEGRNYTRSYNRLLTGDGNIVTVDAVVQYHVLDLRNYLFNTASLADTSETAGAGTKVLLGKLADAAIRTAVVHSTLAGILNAGRDAVETDASRQLNAALKSYDTGIVVTRLTFQHVGVPERAGSSDAGVSAAQQDAEQAKAEAQAYADDILPQAKTAADDKIAKAGIYRTTLVNQAQADTARFDAVLAAYRNAPELTRETLYMQSMEEILGNAKKVVVDTRGGNVTVQLLQPEQQATSPASGAPASAKARPKSVSPATNTGSSAPTAAPAGGTHKGKP